MRESWTTYSSTPGGGICECSRCQRRRRRLQPIAQRRCVRFLVTRLASRSPPATSRWPTGQDNAVAPEQRPFLCDSSIVRRETASSQADATSRTKVLSSGKTWRMPVTKCLERQVNILLRCRCGIQMGNLLPRWRVVALLEWTFTQIWMKLSGVLCREMKWVQMKKNRLKLVSCVGTCVLAQWKGRAKT